MEQQVGFITWVSICPGSSEEDNNQQQYQVSTLSLRGSSGGEQAIGHSPLLQSLRPPCHAAHLAFVAYTKTELKMNLRRSLAQNSAERGPGRSAFLKSYFSSLSKERYWAFVLIFD